MTKVAPSDQVIQKTAEACSRQFGPSLRAVILTGSVARGEGSIQRIQSSEEAVGDAEFILIFHDFVSLPQADELRRLSVDVERQLANNGVYCQLDMSCAHDDFLRRMRPHIFGYETRTCGRVIAGEANILSLIPAFTPSEIPLEDAWRLLSNRMVELIEALSESENNSLSTQVCYRTLKLYLDMATSLLLFVGEYAPTYRERSDNLCKLASDGTSLQSFPFSLQLFSQAVKACTTEKLSLVDFHGVVKDRDWVAAACRTAFQLWMWELRQISGSISDSSPSDLCLLAMSRQPWPVRYRGWLFALRRYGWRRSSTWPRWLNLARRASPRYWVYAVAGELFQRDESLLEGSSNGPDENPLFAKMWNALPVIPPRVTPRDTLALCRAVAWNYREFLKDTRS